MDEEKRWGGRQNHTNIHVIFLQIFIINFLLTTPHHIFLWNYSVVKPGRCVICLFPQSDLPLLYQLDRLHNNSSCLFPSSKIIPCFEKILIIIFDTKLLWIWGWVSISPILESGAFCICSQACSSLISQLITKRTVRCYDVE